MTVMIHATPPLYNFTPGVHHNDLHSPNSGAMSGWESEPDPMRARGERTHEHAKRPPTKRSVYISSISIPVKSRALECRARNADSDSPLGGSPLPVPASLAVTSHSARACRLQAAARNAASSQRQR